LILIIRFEEVKSKYPKYLGGYPEVFMHRNSHHGRDGGEEEDSYRYSCEVAWKIYEYFIQDFVCLGYKMPAECLKEECKQ